MIFLVSLLDVDYGLIFWTTLAFLLLWFLLGKYAWKPIIGALEGREQKIDNALREAEKAREEMANLKSEHTQLLNDAKEERARIIREAKEIKDEIIAEAREKAGVEYSKKVNSAQLEINNQKMAAITEVKNLIGTSAIDLAKQVLGRELKNESEQLSFINQEIKKITA